MANAPLLIIQPSADCPVGPFGDWLAEAGASLDVREAWRGELPTSIDGYDGVVCLGGGMNANDVATYPWLADVRLLLGSASTAGVPTLGICLGGQLLASALGGRVVVGPDGPEVGAGLVSKKDAAWVDPLFADLPLMQDVIQFHQDVIGTLPAGAHLMASSPRYPHQAFRAGRCAYGVQFHIETTPEIVQRWAEESPDLAEFSRPGAFETDTLTVAHADVEEIWRPFTERFVRLVTGDLAKVDAGPRTLPMA